jgi:hypothetical protein
MDLTKGLLYFEDKTAVEPGPNPEHKSYSSFTAFTDADFMQKEHTGN